MNVRLISLILLLLPAAWVGRVQARTELVFPASYEEISCTALQTRFTLWSPEAEQVRVQLYKEGRGGASTRSMDLQRKEGGLWSEVFPEDLRGMFCTFQIRHKGNWLSETPGIMPEACGVNGHRAAIVDWVQTNPAGWETDARPESGPPTDAVLYRLQVREFTLGKQSGMVGKGKYPALAEAGTTNANSFSTGLDHLIDLGVSHVCLMPVFDFETDDESRPKEVLTYRNFEPVNFTVPDGLYATRPFDPISRIREFKQVVLAYHKAGIRVLMDVSLDHMAAVPDNALGNTLPGRCFRLPPENGKSAKSGPRNELACEQPFLQEYLLRTLLYWVKEYHVDGFCIDHMGMMDLDAVRSIQAALHAVDPTLFFGGDPTAPGESVYSSLNRALASNRRQLPGLTMTDHDWISAVRGNPNVLYDRGFINGQSGMEEYVKFGLVGGIRHPQVNEAGSPGFSVTYANEPAECLLSLSSLDGYTLYDQLRSNQKTGEPVTELIRSSQLAAGLLLTSQGIPCLQSGEEMLQGREGLPSTDGTPDSICRIDWRNKTYYNSLYEFYRSMVELRKLHPAFRMSNAEQIRKNLHFLDSTGKGVVGYVLDNHANGDSWKMIVVIHNACEQQVEIPVPQGHWTVVVSGGTVNPDGLSRFSGAQANVPSLSTFVAYQ